MIEAERELVFDAAIGKITRSKFLQEFRPHIPEALLADVLLNEALASRMPDDVECALIIGFMFGFSSSSVDVLIDLACEDWHNGHEDIVSALDKLRDPRAIDTLRLLTQTIPEYLEFDESRALATKAIWAIGKIGGSEAISALESIAKCDVELLRDAANFQLQRLSKS